MILCQRPAALEVSGVEAVEGSDHPTQSPEANMKKNRKRFNNTRERNVRWDYIDEAAHFEACVTAQIELDIADAYQIADAAFVHGGLN